MATYTPLTNFKCGPSDLILMCPQCHKRTSPKMHNDRRERGHCQFALTLCVLKLSFFGFDKSAFGCLCLERRERKGKVSNQEAADT